VTRYIFDGGIPRVKKSVARNGYDRRLFFGLSDSTHLNQTATKSVGGKKELKKHMYYPRPRAFLPQIFEEVQSVFASV
jgi:hypothetical protein